MIIVSLVGGPGAGKTTNALLLAGKLKAAGVEAEYVSEAARDRHLEGKLASAAQFDLLASQMKRVVRCFGSGIQVIVTDSPIILQAIYAHSEAERERVIACHDMLAAVCDQRIFVIRRASDKDHSMVGRAHDAEQAKSLDVEVVTLLQLLRVPFTTLARECASDEIFNEIMGSLPLPTP